VSITPPFIPVIIFKVYVVKSKDASNSFNVVIVLYKLNLIIDIFDSFER